MAIKNFALLSFIIGISCFGISVFYCQDLAPYHIDWVKSSAQYNPKHAPHLKVSSDRIRELADYEKLTDENKREIDLILTMVESER